MECSACGRAIHTDQLRCEHCGHDMLPEDIARQPAVKLALVDDLESVIKGLVQAKDRLAVGGQAVPLSRQDAARLAAATEAMTRVRWRLLPILAALIVLALLLAFAGL